jgi:hypothetical protein
MVGSRVTRNGPRRQPRQRALKPRHIDPDYGLIACRAHVFAPFLGTNRYEHPSQQAGAGNPLPRSQFGSRRRFPRLAADSLYVWRAVDSEGEVLDILVQPRREPSTWSPGYRESSIEPSLKEASQA